MKKLPAKAVKEICQAQDALAACLRVPCDAPREIQKALRHVREAHQWIVARVRSSRIVLRRVYRGWVTTHYKEICTDRN